MTLASFSRHSSRIFSSSPSFGTVAVSGIEDVIGVADHAHHGQFAHELVLFLLRERAAFGDVSQPRD